MTELPATSLLRDTNKTAKTLYATLAK